MNIQDYNLHDNEDFDKYLIVQKTLENLNCCKNFYEVVFDDIYFFHKKIKETPNEFVEKMEDDLANKIYYTKKIKRN